MNEAVVKRLNLIAVDKSTGFKSPVMYIDLDHRRCRTMAGPEADIDNFEFIDSRDYEDLRGEYAGRAMQAMIGGMMGNLTLMTQMHNRAEREGYKRMGDMVAADAVGYADALIAELKRPRDYKEIFGMEGGRTDGDDT